MTTEPLSPAEDLLPGAGGLLGRYVLLEKLGEGGMGTVHLAYDPQLERHVAVKWLRASDGSLHEPRLIREAQAMARLSHPNVVNVFDVGTAEGRPFLAMEYVPGQTLREWLDEKPRNRYEVLNALVSAGRGLAAAHAAGIVHRDFKPSNVLMTGDGVPRVTDFGVSRAAADTCESDSAEAEPCLLNSSVTRTGARVGTLAYMAPEQLLGTVVDARADQFAFCLTLFEALTGQRPFPGDTPAERLRALNRGLTPRELRLVPASLRAIFSTGLAFEPEERFESMEPLLLRLDRHRSRRRIVPVSLLSASVLSALLLGALPVYQRWEAARAPCRELAEGVRLAWNEERKTQLRTSIFSSSKSDAAALWAEVEQKLDRHIAQLSSSAQAACQSVPLFEDQDAPGLRALGQACLEARLNEVSAMAELLATVEGPSTSRIADAVGSLQTSARCADPRYLQGRFHIAPKPLQEQVAQIHREHAKVIAHSALGLYEEGERQARALLPRALSTGFLPLIAKLQYTVANMDVALSRPTVEQSYRDAMLTAEAAGHDEIKAMALAQLGYVVGHLHNRPEEGRELARQALAAVKRLGGHPRAEGLARNTLASIAYRQSNLVEAAAEYQRAIDAFRQPEGSANSALVSESNLLLVYQDAGEHARALIVGERLMNQFRQSAGRAHPYLAKTALKVGDTLRALGRVRDALENYQLASRAMDERLGNEHRWRAILARSAALALQLSGGTDEAQAQIEQARRYFREAGDGVGLAETWVVQGRIELLRERPEAAVEAFGQALPVLREKFGASHLLTLSAEAGVGAALVELGRAAEARRRLNESHQTAHTVLGPENPVTMELSWALARAELGVGRAQGLPRLTEAMARTQRLFGTDNAVLAAMYVELGRAQWAAGKLAEGRAAAQKALQLLRTGEVRNAALEKRASRLLVRTSGDAHES